MKSVPYLAAVGALMYLATSTCPDIAHTVGYVKIGTGAVSWSSKLQSIVALSTVSCMDLTSHLIHI